MLAVGMALARVVGIVTLLAESGQVVGGVVGRIMVEVRGGEDDPAAGLGMGLAVHRAAPFTVAPGALEADVLGNLGPVGRVEVFQGWMDRHCISFAAGRDSYLRA